MIDRLIEGIKEKKCPVCIGLDTKFDYIPKAFLTGDSEGDVFQYAADNILRFNKAIVDATKDIVPSVKVQVAYYEMYGYEGMRAFAETIRYAKEKGLIVIADIKRNDIDATAAAYSAAYLGKTEVGGRWASAFDADFVTLNAYLGTDGIKPFVDDCKTYNKGAFVLVKTSNKSSGELQDLMAGEKTVYEHMADYVTKWGEDLVGKYGYSGIGAVVGATYPEQAKKIREGHPHIFVLIPGYGAQGAGAEKLVANFDKNGLGGVVNNSRAILLAHKSDQYASMPFDEAARAATLAMKRDILETFDRHGIAF